MATYGFNHNDNNKGFNPFEVMSIILTVLVIVVGVILFQWAKEMYTSYVPFIEIKCSFLGSIGIIIIKFLFSFLLLMMFGILHIAIVVKTMEFIRKLFNF